jgi:uncharacterized membrane protein (DUF373 family)
MQILATALFFIVFIEIFVTLSIYLSVTVFAYIKKQRKEKHSTKKEED